MSDSNQIEQITVGDVVLIDCLPSQYISLDSKSLSFTEEAEAVPKIKVLKARWKNPKELEIAITSYQTGNHDFSDLKLAIGSESLSLGAFQLRVATVMKEENEVRQEPFPPIGPLLLPIPSWVWFFLGGGVFFTLLILGVYLWRRRQRRQLEIELRKLDSAVSPIAEYFVNYRKWQREFIRPTQVATVSDLEKQEALTKFDHSFKLFLTRTLHVPAHKWSSSLVAKEIYKKTEMRELAIEIQALLRECLRMKGKIKFQIPDLARLYQKANGHCQALADQLKVKGR